MSPSATWGGGAQRSVSIFDFCTSKASKAKYLALPLLLDEEAAERAVERLRVVARELAEELAEARRLPGSAHVSMCKHTSAYVCMRQRIRQNTSAYASLPPAALEG